MPPAPSPACVARTGRTTAWPRLVAATAVTRELLPAARGGLIVSYGLDRPESAFKQSYLLAAKAAALPQEAGSSVS